MKTKRVSLLHHGLRNKKSNQGLLFESSLAVL